MSGTHAVDLPVTLPGDDNRSPRTFVTCRLADTGPRQGLRRPLRLRQWVDVLDAAVRARDAVDVVGAAHQVVDHESRGIGDLFVVTLTEEGEAATVELAAR